MLSFTRRVRKTVENLGHTFISTSGEKMTAYILFDCSININEQL